MADSGIESNASRGSTNSSISSIYSTIDMEERSVFLYSWSQQRNNVIRIYGIGDDGSNICIDVNDFQPFIHLELPTTIDWSNKTNGKSNSGILLDHIIQSDSRNAPIRKMCKVAYKHKLYNQGLSNQGGKYQCARYPYLVLYFENVSKIKNFNPGVLTIPEFGSITLIKRETGVSPIIQFCVSRKIPMTGWVKIKGVKREKKTTLCEEEYLISGANIKSDEANTNTVKAKIMAWDIETFSLDGKFPDGSRPEDVVFQISCVFFNYGSGRYKKYLLTLGDPEEIDDVIIKRFSSEEQLIMGMVHLQREEKPIMVTGWNIFGFDYAYLLERARKIRNIEEFMVQGLAKSTPAVEKEIKSFTKAHGSLNLKFIDIEGIIPIDLMDVFQKEHKLDSYSLNNVSAHFLNSKKDDLDHTEIHKCFLKGMETLDGVFTKSARMAMAKVGKYCVQDSLLVAQLFENQQTFLSLSEMARTCSTPILSVHVNGQQVKFFNQVYNYCHHNNIVVDKEDYMVPDDERYRGAEVIDPVPGLYNYVVPFDFASLYPSIIIAYNLDYLTFVHDETIPDELCHIMEWEDHISCEHDPNVIRKVELTELINALRSKNKNQEEKNRLADYVRERSTLTKKMSKNFICAKRRYRFLKTLKGVLPNIIKNLLDTRKAIRMEIKKIQKDKNMDPKEKESLVKILDKRQSSYKISANSMYGATGVRRGRLPFIPIAMCTTFIGRVSIRKAENLIENIGGSVIYGDTDSNYIIFDKVIDKNLKDTDPKFGKEIKKLWDHSTNMAQEISKHFKSPITMEFENVIYTKFLILTKKRYMYLSCNDKGEFEMDGAIKKIGKRGVILSRRDNCKFMREVYLDTINNVFDGRSGQELIYSLSKKIHSLYTRSIEYGADGVANKLVITKSVGDYEEETMGTNEKGEPKIKMGNYIVAKTPGDLESTERREWMIGHLPAQIQLDAKIKKRGGVKEDGSRISFVVLDIGRKGKQSEKIESYDYYLRHSDVLSIDYDYYVERLIEPIDQVLNAILPIKENNPVRYGPKFEKSKLFQKIFSKHQPLGATKSIHKVLTNHKKVMEEIMTLTEPILVVEGG